MVTTVSGIFKGASVNCRLSIASTRYGSAQKVVGVYLTQGEWPSDDDLITICDNAGVILPNGQYDMRRGHFGGHVLKHPNRYATVTIYTD